MAYLLSIDQGTTSSRAVIYRTDGRMYAHSQQEFKQSFPQPGWVEHDPMEIWESVLQSCKKALASQKISANEILAIGITNQRETVLLWDRKSGIPLTPAIVWQDRRTAADIEEIKAEGKEEWIRHLTGLIPDAYFSASKIAWLLEHNPELRRRAEAGEIAMGTIDTWVVYRLTKGRSHITDISNASRTMLMNLHTGTWDQQLLELFDIPPTLLPEIVSNCGELALTDAEHFGKEIPICGMAGDQQSALFGQSCTEPGMVKCTYGTGCFLLMMLGTQPQESKHRLLTTVAWRLQNEPIHYALEGSVFVGGAAIQWLRDGLKIISTAEEVNRLAGEVEDSGGVIFVPAFTGLGSPYWDASARGTLLGLTRGTTRNHIARATLEGIAFQVNDLLSSMEKDTQNPPTCLRVDGGACASDLLMQIQADFSHIRVERPRDVETTARGAMYLAGLGVGLWKSPKDFQNTETLDRTFHSSMDPQQRKKSIAHWDKAVHRTLDWNDPLL